MNRKFRNNIKNEQEIIQVYYKGQFTSHYKQEEQLPNIINSHTAPQENRTNIKLNIYYKNKKLRHLILSVNNNRKSDSRVVYQYACKEATCNGASYIGYIACAVLVSFYSHVQNGFMQRHK